MRRIVSACLLQTLRADTINGSNPEEELEIYCRKLDSKRTEYVIEDKKKESDGSLIVRIRKQYNTYKTAEMQDKRRTGCSSRVLLLLYLVFPLLKECVKMKQNKCLRFGKNAEQTEQGGSRGNEERNTP